MRLTEYLGTEDVHELGLLNEEQSLQSVPQKFFMLLFSIFVASAVIIAWVNFPSNYLVLLVLIFPILYLLLVAFDRKQTISETRQISRALFHKAIAREFTRRSSALIAERDRTEQLERERLRRLREEKVRQERAEAERERLQRQREERDRQAEAEREWLQRKKEERDRQAQAERERLERMSESLRSWQEFVDPPDEYPDGLDEWSAEVWVRNWMEWMGASDCYVTQASSDGGVDVVSKDFIAQVKNYTNTVPIAAIREFVGVVSIDPAKRLGLFFTSGKYPQAAYQVAENANLALFTYDVTTGTVRGNSTCAELYKRTGLNAKWVNSALADLSALGEEPDEYAREA